MPLIRRSDLYKIFFRCFLVQGSWNFQSMIGLGFCYCSIPIMKRLYKSADDREKFLKRHIYFFNSHPYFASWCLGAVAKLEEEYERKGWADHRPIDVFKERLVGPLGALGDRLFWANIKPASAGIGVWLALLIGWMAIPVFLLVYNIPHIYIRANGLFKGYAKGFDIVSDISERHFKVWIKYVSIIGMITAGLCLGTVMVLQVHKGFLYLVFFLVSVLLSFVFSRLNKPVNLALIVASLINITLAIVFNL